MDELNSLSNVRFERNGKTAHTDAKTALMNAFISAYATTTVALMTLF